jgi:hypothetical protein
MIYPVVKDILSDNKKYPLEAKIQRVLKKKTKYKDSRAINLILRAKYKPILLYSLIII